MTDITVETDDKDPWEKPFTAVSIKRPVKDGKYADKGCKGLFLWVRGNSRVWQMRCVQHNKAHTFSLGSLATVSLKEARDKVAEIRVTMNHGEMPSISKKVETKLIQKGRTLREDVYDFWEHRRGNWDQSYTTGWIHAFENHILPKIGDKETSTLRVDDLAKTLLPVWTTRRTTGDNLRIALNAVFQRAMRLDDEDKPRFVRPNPCIKLLDQLPRIARPASVQHPSIPWREAPSFYKDLTGIDSQGATALRFLLLCCTPRAAEITGAAWSEIEIYPPGSNLPGRGIFRVPQERMKSGKARDIPLSAAAAALIETMTSPRPGFLFPAKRHRASGEYQQPPPGPMHGDWMQELLRRVMKLPWHVHGMRATFSTWVENNPVLLTDDRAAEIALDHTVHSDVKGRYKRTDMLEERAELAERWAAFLLG